MKWMRLTVNSGGQTGVDRMALDAAMDANVSCGGRCAEGRLAEDESVPARYPLQELSGAGYIQRTIESCEQLQRTHVALEAAVTPIEEVAAGVVEFERRNGV